METIPSRIDYEVAKEDYEELEGKIVTWVRTDQIRHKCMIVGLNRAVGITIVDAKDTNQYLVCINGPVMPNGGDISDFTDYNELFEVVIGSIAAGVIHADELLEYQISDNWGTGPDGSDCPYSQ